MRNYPNMSYCMCENTLGALEQIVDAMKEHDSPEAFVVSLSDSERVAFQRLIFQIHDIAEMTEINQVDLADKCWA